VRFDADGSPEVWARIVHCTEEFAYLMLLPGTNEVGHVNWYIPTPRRAKITSLQKGDYRFVDYTGPARWYWKDKDLDQLRDADHTRCHVDEWKKDRDQQLSLIRPLIEQYSLAQILERSLDKTWPSARSKEVGVERRFVVRALRMYLLSLGEEGALLPAFDKSGGRGKPKFSRVPTGRRVEHPRSDGSSGFACTESDREEIQAGWKKYKKKGVSTEVAYLRTLNENRIKTIAQDGLNVDVTLRPEGEIYSIGQFRRHGPRGKANLSASAINAGETSERPRTQLRRRRPGLRPASVALEGQIDATPCDFYPVSLQSRLRTLRAPTRFELVDSELGYTFGVHVGFEHPSTCSALLTLLNGAEDHIEFCARYGIVIESHQWHSRNFRRIKADNGEMKAANAFMALQEAQQTGEFCRTYMGEDKAMVESRHRSRQRHVDHLSDGTNYGTRQVRGESSPKLNAGVNMDEYMFRLIKNILWKNNDERVDHLLTTEMREEGVRPYRGDIYRWCLSRGYVVDEPVDLTSLRARCLPILDCVLHVDGIHLVDPTRLGRRLIKGLVYRSEWLNQSGLLDATGRRRRRYVARLNPSEPSEIFVDFGDALHRLILQTNDPLLRRLTLIELLDVQTDDRADRASAKASDLNARASRIKETDEINANARRQKRAEIEKLPRGVTKAELTRNVDANTRREMAATSPHFVPDLRDRALVPSTAFVALAIDTSTREAIAQLRRRRNE